MKDFKLAHIVPVSCLHITEGNHYHMCLAHLAAQSDKYCEFYRTMSNRHKFVLMDNGAAEDEQCSNEELLRLYGAVQPTEIVVPDTILEGWDTLSKMEAFVDKYGDVLPYRFMGVPQGHTMEEWKACACLMMKERRINTIGISKFINIATGSSLARLEAAMYVDKLAKEYDRDDLELHLLGCDEGPGIVSIIQREVERVRGCDTAFAYIVAQAGKPIGSNTQRPSGVIDFLYGEVPNGLIDRLDEMEIVTGVGDNAAPDSWTE